MWYSVCMCVYAYIKRISVCDTIQVQQDSSLNARWKMKRFHRYIWWVIYCDLFLAIFNFLSNFIGTMLSSDEFVKERGKRMAWLLDDHTRARRIIVEKSVKMLEASGSGEEWRWIAVHILVGGGGSKKATENINCLLSPCFVPSFFL